MANNTNRNNINAKDEFLQHIHSIVNINVTLKCARISLDTVEAKLPCHWNNDEFKEFTDSIDITYYNGYGSQELFGDIWYSDGTYSSRWEYDGSEGWEYYIAPDIPADMLRPEIGRDVKITKLLT